MTEGAALQLREAAAEDLAAVHAINQANVPAVGDIAFADLVWYFERAACLRVAEIDGAIAGFLLGLRPGLDYRSLNYAWFSRRYRDFFYVDRVAVAEPYRRRGVAGTLYDDAFDRARDAGAPVLACEVNLRPRNDASLAFHERLGFEAVGEQDTDDGRKRVVMLVRAVEPTSRG